MNNNYLHMYLKQGWGKCLCEKPSGIPITHYWCDECHKVFGKGVTDEECQQEADIHFPDLKDEDKVTTCDDCFKEIMAYNNHPIGQRKEYKE